MTARLFFEAMGEVADQYYMEAAFYAARASKAGKRRIRRLFVRAAVAAALIAALSVTAYAVYQAYFKDYFLAPIPTPAGTSEPADILSQPLAGISMVGYQGTPEYLALEEWLDWKEEHPAENYLAPDGGDDNTDYAWPDHHPFYGAYYTAQGQALDAILDKYDLKPHTNTASASLEEIYDALGTEPLLSEAYSGGGYIYDDGTVDLQVSDPANEINLTLFASVKGTLTDIHGFASTVYDEWSYAVPFGETVDLIVDDRGVGYILFETDGAYIIAEASHDFPGLTPMTKDELEAVADGINFAALADRFDGSAHPETADRVAALRENMLSADPNAAEPFETPNADEDHILAVSDEKISEAVLEDLGRYTFCGLPAGFADSLSGFENEQVYHGTSVQYDSVSGWYSQQTREYRLQYARFRNRDMTSDEYLDLIQKTILWSVSGTVSSCQVNGCDALLWDEGNGYSVYWYDTEADLLFIVSIYASPHGGEPVTEEEAISAAESVVKVPQ